MTADSQSLISLVDEAARRGISLWPDGDGKLGFRAPKGALTEELRANLATHRDALVNMMSGPKFCAHGPRERTPFLKYYGTRFWKAIRNGSVGVSFTNGPHWVVQVDGPFSIEAFAASVAFVAGRHDILNVTIREFDESPVFCRKHAPAPHIVELPDGSTADDLRRVLTDIVWRPFEPEVDLLLRPFVVRVSESRHVIGFVLNHLVGDAFSVGMIREELMHAYELAASGNRLEVARPEVQYADYIVAVNDWLASPAQDYRLTHWGRRLEGIEPCKPPVDHAVEPGHVSEISVHNFTFGPEQARLVQRVAGELSTTVYFVLIAAYARALCAVTRQPEASIVSLHHGRDYPLMTRTVGSMQNQLLLRIPVAESESFAALVRTCERVQNEALQFQLPFGWICQYTPGAPPQTAYPELNCSFPANPAGRGSPSAAANRAREGLRNKMTLIRVPDPTGSATRAGDFPGVKLALRADDSEIRGCLVYLESEYEPSTMARFAEMITESVEPVEEASSLMVPISARV